mmetsp:Transcript_1706/g.3843  ORF Transcript_1706/g.3843 Transcript_1706/m.3843 type:complete len:265 (-) Transcript_1706:31-825(-)
MDIGLRIVGEIEVHDHLDIIDVETTSGNISSHKKSCLTTLEFPKHPITLLLTLVTMHSTCLEAIHAKRASKHITAFLRLHKDQHTILGSEILPEVTEEVAILVLIGTDINHLGNIFVSGQIKRSHGNLVEVAEVITGEILDFLWPSSTPHKNLTIRANLRDNLAQLRLETHVKHTIGFIKNQVRDALEIRVPLLQMINQTSRCGNHNLNSLPERPHLLTFRNSSVDDSVLDLRGRSKLIALLFDLDGEFAGGSKDEDDGSFTRL